MVLVFYFLNVSSMFPQFFLNVSSMFPQCFFNVSTMFHRWNKPATVTLNDRQCRTCMNDLEGNFSVLLECPLYNELRKL